MSFKEKAVRIKEWCKNHKKEIIITATGVVGFGAVCYGAKRTFDIMKVAKEGSLEQYDQLVGEFEVAMFANGVRKQFLNAGADDYVSDVGDSIGKLKDIVQKEDAVSALRHNENILCMAQGVAADRGSDVIEAVKDSFPGIDDLEIWVGGTVKE